MTYAIIRSGGKQFRVEADQQIRVPLVAKNAGDTVELEVLALGTDNGVQIGAPSIAAGAVSASVVSHGRADKIIVFKKKRRKQYKRTKGHRQDFTLVKINSIGESNADTNGATDEAASSEQQS